MYKPLACALLLSCSFSLSFAQGATPSPAPQNISEKKTDGSKEKSDGSQTAESNNDGEANDAIFEDVEVNDPLELLNRGMHYINGALDFCLIKPLAVGYRWVVPEVARNRVDDFLTNLRAPISFVNHILQAEPKRAFNTLSSFVVNSTAGFLGVYNTARHLNITSVETNFNETLGRWGIDTGPYLIVPILGSCSFRGVVGLGGDYMTDPVNLYLFLHGPEREAVTIGSYVRTGVHTIHEREKYIEAIEELQKTSEDMYATLRSIYFQQQKKKIEKLRESDNPDTINQQDNIPASQSSLG